MRFIFVVCLLLSSVCFSASENNELDLNQQYQKSIEILDEVIIDDRVEAWELSKIRVRMRSKFGLEVPYLAKLEIKPFIEFHYSE